MALDVLVPEDRQRDVLALDLPMDRLPLGLDLPTVTALRAGVGEQPDLAAPVISSGSGQLSSLEALERRPDQRSHGSVRHQQTSTKELRALGAWSFCHPVCPASSRNGGRDHLGMAGGIIPE
jgi:hypothetical protein